MGGTQCDFVTTQEERRTKAAMYLGRAAAAVEEGNFRQLLRGAEREAERRQRVARSALLYYCRLELAQERRSGYSKYRCCCSRDGGTCAWILALCPSFHVFVMRSVLLP